MEAKIYKAEWRAKIQRVDYCCWTTFNPAEIRLDGLLLFKDELLGSQTQASHSIAQDAVVWLLPFVGGIDFECGSEKGFVHIGQLQTITVKKGETLVISNPYENETVRYFHWHFSTNRAAGSELTDFDLSEKNTLIPISKSEDIDTFIGIYEGRAEEEHKLGSNRNKLFTFIIRGAFEFQNRLLEASDALHLIGVESIEFEALSENAMLLVVEI